MKYHVMDNLPILRGVVRKADSLVKQGKDREFPWIASIMNFVWHYV